MNFQEFLKSVLAARSSKRPALSERAVQVVFNNVVDNNIGFDDDKDFKFYVNSLREKSIVDLQEEYDRIFEDAEELEDFINDKDDHYFVGITGSTVVYTFTPSAYERW